jgi:hypothetical protein
MFRHGDHVEYRAFRDTWKPGLVYAVLSDGTVVIFAASNTIGTELYERRPEDVRKI